VTDAEARRTIREDLDATVFVEAAAGTGKTTELVGRIVSLLSSGKSSLDRVVAVTFTEKAAGELKLRLRADIERARAAAPEGSGARQHLEQAIRDLELARIGTIHGFCSDLLHERPVEGAVDPLFGIAPEDESERLLDRAFDDWFQRVLAGPPEGVRRILRRRPRGPNAQGPRDALRGAVGRLVEHRDFETGWRRAAFDRDTAIDGVMSALDALGALHGTAQDPEDWLARNVANVARWLAENPLREQVRGRDHDALEAELRELARIRRIGWHYKGRRRQRFSDDVTREEVLERRDGVKEALDTLVADCDADLAPCLREELRPVVAAYQGHKRNAGVLDFVDLLIAARDLLVRDREARGTLQGLFDHYFVDEFQDTDPLQAEILLLLAADDPEQIDWLRAKPVPGKLFLVGDPKQSIYRFRRADVVVYEETKQRLAAAGAKLVHLTTSFRAPPSLQAVVNAAFEPLMQGAPDGSQARYVPLEGARDEVADRPTLVALPAPAPYGDFGRVVNWRIDESLPDAVGAFVHWLIAESGWTVKDRDEEGREVDEPIRPRHVCLLFRRFKNYRDDVTRPYVRALEARRVPHVLVGGRSFHEREEVLAIRNAMAAVEWPDDELRVFATLRGPLFALGDDALLAYRHAFGTLHPLRPQDGEVPEGDLRDVAESLAVLRRLHGGRNRRPLADTVSRLLEAVRAHAGIAIWPTGEQALANCLRMVDLARRFEQRGASSFRAFVERLEDDALRGEAQDAPVVEEGTEGVRIMTAHRAKGLEFPVVVLCDPTCRATRDEPSRWVDPASRLWAEPLAGCTPRELLDNRELEVARDRHEAVRLAYVAATRARDLLVVPVVADQEIENSWLHPLQPVVYPDPASRGEGEPALGCPSFGDEAMVVRPRSARRPDRAPVRPGRSWPRAGRQPVVWWDPKLLELDASQDVGLRQQQVLEADESGAVAEEGVRAHEAWRAARSERLERGGRASIVAAPVSALAEAAPGEAAGVEVETVAGDRQARPHGRRFGILVHAVLAVVDLDAEDAALEAAARLQGRLVGASEEEVAAAAGAARAALGHPILRRAAVSEAVRRETPVLLRTEDGTLAEGIVDLAFREQGDTPRWTVVDFKTDREVESRRDVYAAQVRLYAKAVERATGEAADGLLLVV
jgi:ATP-dependent exoDNAse (exonuclease V) beta subunit